MRKDQRQRKKKIVLESDGYEIRKWYIKNKGGGRQKLKMKMG